MQPIPIWITSTLMNQIPVHLKRCLNARPDQLVAEIGNWEMRQLFRNNLSPCPLMTPQRTLHPNSGVSEFF
jgi:hypothetical protein